MRTASITQRTNRPVFPVEMPKKILTAKEIEEHFIDSEVSRQNLLNRVDQFYAEKQ